MVSSSTYDDCARIYSVRRKKKLYREKKKKKRNLRRDERKKKWKLKLIFSGYD